MAAFERKKKRKKNRRGNPDSRQRQDELSPLVPRGRVNCLCPGSDDGVMMGKGEGGVSGPIRVSRRGKGELQGWLESLSGLHIHTHIHTHLLSRRFRNCRLRPDHPQEGKQALISALQGPALSPGLSPLHTTHYAHHATHKLPDHLTSHSQIQKFYQK